ncbi:hypothetical protein, unlikely [Trypanosoma congolense IL3000]|uniref:Uncharacterized protein n=1 Tax=Trypanosoma congolense (strain IL3000) TaxID=1068625 RepID=F9WA27_TRYCI|nr:hypothetical protein, unlikely [Trypanosoma congolense IL3000]
MTTIIITIIIVIIIVVIIDTTGRSYAVLVIHKFYFAQIHFPPFFLFNMYRFHRFKITPSPCSPVPRSSFSLSFTVFYLFIEELLARACARVCGETMMMGCQAKGLITLDKGKSFVFFTFIITHYYFKKNIFQYDRGGGWG